MPRLPLFRRVDAIEIPVPTLEAGLTYYRDRLGQALIWRTDTAAGLRMADSETEIVLQSDGRDGAVDILVASADDAAAAVVGAGGRVIAEPFDIPIGRCAVVEDPWGNRLILLDARNGTYETDHDGHIVGLTPPA
jgi:predicted enzyme related to lactoylglutathione lyase